MKQYRHRARFLGLTLVFLMIFVFLFQSCEPGGGLIIENMHNDDVSIYFSTVIEHGSTDTPVKQGIISANDTETFGIAFPRKDWIRRIEAIDRSGKVIFSHDYTMADLEKIGWKIVIPP